jgi:predicted CoA-binding protein
MSERGRRIETDGDLRELLNGTQTIAVLGMRSEAVADRPAHYVPAAAKAAGYRIIPVPVYEPEATTMLGEPVVRKLAAIGSPVDLVDVFRKPQDLAAHLDDVLAARPRAVWLQSGIRDEAFGEAVLAAGIDLVEDRCLMVEIRRLGTRPAT